MAINVPIYSQTSILQIIRYSVIIIYNLNLPPHLASLVQVALLAPSSLRHDLHDLNAIFASLQTRELVVKRSL